MKKTTYEKIYERPKFPKRAVITAGMPYGNKSLHFGHVGGLFVHADTYARFLRDRIGAENVIFVSGTDCYGSPIEASFKKEVENGFDGTIESYVMRNHEHQRETLKAYGIEPNLYATSAFGRAGAIHRELSHEIFNTLKASGLLVEMTKPQFYDDEAEKYLNGRQVIGRCPIDGCRSEKAYADECDLGHQFMPSDLIDPVSTLTGNKPSLRDATNWYFKLDAYKALLSSRMEYLKLARSTRGYIISAIEEFLKSPVIYLKRKDFESEVFECQAVKAMPNFELEDASSKHSVTLSFSNLDDREAACKGLDAAGIRYRTGKTLVPFRLTGNSEWGISVPDTEALTFWVWPESLWAPISFTKAYLESVGKNPDEWKSWWKGAESEVYQFIGEDNIYFYGIAEMALFPALDGYMPNDDVDWSKIKLPTLVSNKHILYMDKKASSSGKLKPPMAHELLDHYTADQLRIHFLSLGLARKSVSFSPQVFIPEEDREGKDPVLKDGNLLTNVFNRLARSCFYTAQKHNDGRIPNLEVSEAVVDASNAAILELEKHMHDHEFHRVVYVLDEYLRKMNKHWAKNMREADSTEDHELRLKTLCDGFHALRTAVALIHPVAPSGCEAIVEYLNIDKCLWDWEDIFKPISELVDLENHKPKHLEPKHDFFKKHESQFRS